MLLGTDPLNGKTLVPGRSYTLNIDTTGDDGGLLSAWIDFNSNGSFGDTGEQITADQVISGGAGTVTFTVPATATVGTTWARFRYAGESGLAPTGLALSGEVEDYQLAISSTAMSLTKVATSVADNDSTGDSTEGDVVTYTVTAKNDGTGTLSAVTISDPMVGLSALTCSPSQPATLTAGSSMACTATYQLTAADAQNGSVSNTATLRANGLGGVAVTPVTATAVVAMAPVAVADDASTAAGESVAIDVLANDAGVGLEVSALTARSRSTRMERFRICRTRAFRVRTRSPTRRSMMRGMR